MSADGRSLYVSSDLPDEPSRVVAIRRNPTTGRLTQGDCVVAAADERGCVAARGVAGALHLAVSPDGRTVYVAGDEWDAVGPTSQGIAAFAAKPSRGQLRMPGKAGCVLQVPRLAASCEVAPTRLRDASVGPMAFSPDGTELYLASAGAVVVLARKPTTGALAATAGPGTCVRTPSPWMSSRSARRQFGKHRGEPGRAPSLCRWLQRPGSPPARLTREPSIPATGSSGTETQS